MLQNFDFLILLRSLVFIYGSFLAGDLVFRAARMELDSPIQRVILRILAGYGALAMIGLAAALGGFFNALFLRFVFLAVGALSFRRIQEHIQTLLRRPKEPLTRLGQAWRRETLLKIIVALWLAVNLAAAFTPITGTDAKVYHLPIISDLISNQRLTFDPAIRYYHELPLLAEVFYAVPTAIFAEDYAPFTFQLLQYGVLPLTLALLFDFGRRHIRRGFLRWGLVIGTLALFDFQREILHAGYIDVLVFLFGLAGTILVIANITGYELKRREIILAAALAALAAGMKYLGLFFVFLNVLFLIGHTWSNRLPVRRTLLLLVQSGLVVLAVAGYWYVRNLVWFSNPVYPMFSSEEFRTSVGWFSVEKTPLNFFLFPFLRFGQWFVDPDETSSHLVVLAFFIAFYLLLGLAALRRSLSPPALLLAVFIQLYLAFSFFGTHQIRFMLPALIMLPLAIALLTDRLLEGSGRIAGRMSALARAGLAALAIFVFLGNFHYFQIRFLYVAGIYTREQYIGSIGSQ